MAGIEIKKISKNIWEIPQHGKMIVPGRIFASENLVGKIKKDETIKQICNVASLPGIVKYSIALPDAHMGYGFSVGGVAAFDIDKGIISPGGIGFDINCGVRLLSSNLSKNEFLKKRKETAIKIRKDIPSGVGRAGYFRLSEKEIKEILKDGVNWAIRNGYGEKEDAENCEDGGCLLGAEPDKVSARAVGRGRNQLGTIGAGNHFLEIQEVEEIIDEKAAEAFGIKKGKICVLIHSGSRGLGHQTCSDYIVKMEEKYGHSHLADRQLAYAPIKSRLGEDYIGAMKSAANFAFCNRQLISHLVREAFKKYFPASELKLVYDVAHNIAKQEEFEIDGKKRKLYVHRKGATRSFGKGNKAIPKKYRNIGQPIFIPGSMGTASYVLAGQNKAGKISFSSAPHGAGRELSRSYAVKNISAQKIKEQLKKKDILIEAGSVKGIAEEAPEAYKDVEEVVRVSHELGIAKKVAKLKPLAVIKG